MGQSNVRFMPVLTFQTLDSVSNLNAWGSSLMDSNDKIHQLRYRAIVDSPLYVALQRQDDDTAVQGGELLDISLTGARLAVESTFRFGERFQLHLESQDGELSTKVACRVQWIRDGRTNEECTIGCTFESELDSDVLDELVERAILERRESDRQHVADHSVIEAVLRNASPGTKVGAE